MAEGSDLGIATVTIAGKEIKGLKKFYAEATPGEPGAIFNSSGALEIFMYQAECPYGAVGNQTRRSRASDHYSYNDPIPATFTMRFLQIPLV